ncbi:MAG: DNA-binding protein [Rhodoglobus sp.]
MRPEYRGSLGPGISREGLYKALPADGNPSFAMIVKVATALGFRLEFHAVA